MKLTKITKLLIAISLMISCSVWAQPSPVIQLGVRPMFLVELMAPSILKDQLIACKNKAVKKSLFSIAHRGAPLQFAEHTVESNKAAALMGAGILECDVTFTKDKKLVCRHSQNDLHTTTNILLTDLASTCIKPFAPAAEGTLASAECRASDITLAQYQSLTGKMDGFNKDAKTPFEFVNGTPDWRTNLYAKSSATLLTHKESIALFKELGAKFTPELKEPVIPMPYDGYSQEDYAQALINDYKEAGIVPSDVYPQSFKLSDVLFWIKHEPLFGRQAIYLDGCYDLKSFDPNNLETIKPSMQELKQMGVNYIAPPIWVLLTVDGRGEIVPSAYAKAAKAANLNIITWSLERDGSLKDGGAWYHQSIRREIHSDGQIYSVLDVLAKKVGIKGIFSDWPATTTYYANCMDL